MSNLNAERVLASLTRLTEHKDIPWICSHELDTYMALVNGARVSVIKYRTSGSTDDGDKFAHRLTIVKGQGAFHCYGAEELWNTIEGIGMNSEIVPWSLEIEAQANSGTDGHAKENP